MWIGLLMISKLNMGRSMIKSRPMLFFIPTELNGKVYLEILN